jgi:conserved membrane protein yqhQ
MEEKVVVGGQAVVEGVMMRGPKAIATAVRKHDGSIVYKKIELTEKNNKWFKIPFIRGVFALFDAMVVGTKELIFASNQAGLEEEKLNDSQITWTVTGSILLGVAIFMVLPSYIGGFIFKEKTVMANILEAIVKLVFFLGYIWGISFFKDIKRVFEYHGAEHKSIINYEEGTELTPENAKKCTRFHPRCGTSFLLLVMFISILVFSVVDLLFGVTRENSGMVMFLIYKLITRVLFVPVVAGISYELQRWTSYHLNNSFAKMIAKPGMWLQKITTSEPDESQLEVAIVALNVALGKEVTNATEVFE